MLFFDHCLICPVLFLMLAIACGYPRFRDSIPNGRNIPHPCSNSYIWEGVGHENPSGGGTRNQFGIDFGANGHQWDRTPCMMDSDGDGRTNGEELGDPDCIWTPGSQPTVISGMTHPGVCDPVDSAECQVRNTFVGCSGTSGFDCPATQETGTFTFEARIPEMEVPVKDTTYMCMTFEFPSDKSYHITATEPIIANKDVLHHTLVYACKGNDAPPHELVKPKECGMKMGVCREIIGLWGVGYDGQCLNNNMGFLVGGDNGFKYAVMQLHWNNPRRMPNYRDSSGMKFYMTPNLRLNNAGVLMIGQEYLAIPPNSVGYTATGSCDEDCTPRIMKNDIYVTTVINHMHLNGLAQITELRRNRSLVQDLARDDVFDYNTPVPHEYVEPVVVRRGDELKTTCVFQSVGREMTTNFGDATNDEMCFAFLTYYPKENINTEFCTSWKSLGFCELSMDKVKRGCDMEQLGNYSNPETSGIRTAVATRCTPFECRKECLELVRQLKKNNPCYHGDVGDLVRYFALLYASPEQKSETIAWFTRMDSCDWELWSEGYQRNDSDTFVTDASLITSDSPPGPDLCQGLFGYTVLAVTLTLVIK